MQWKQIGSGIGALLLFLFLPGAALAAAQQGWRAIGQVGGPTQGVAVQGRYAYVGVGLRLVILDISNPADMREVGVTPPFPHFVEDVAVSGTLAYVAAGVSGLRVVDVSNPALPAEIGAWDSRGYANGVAVTGSVAYLADGPYGLRVVDVSTPSNPFELGSAYSMNYAFKVAVQGPRVFIAAAGAGVLIADVSDPRHPVEVGSFCTGGYAYGVTVAGDRAFVADGWEGLKIVNVADAAHPYLAGAYKTPGWAFGVAVTGNKAYVADAFRGLRVIDVADPARPIEVARSEMPNGNASSVSVADGIAYVTDRFVGLRAVSLSGSSSLVQMGSYHSFAYADGVAVAGNRAYVATNTGLAVVDIADPARPRQSGNLDLGYATSVAVWGQWACVAMSGGGATGLRIVDVSDPAHPTAVATHVKAPGLYRDMTVSEGIAYGANEWGLEMVRVSDPLHPEWLGFLRMQTGNDAVASDTVVGVAASGTMAYTASSSLGLEVVDVSDPRNPILKGSTPAGSAQDVAVAGNRVYVAGFSGLFIVDVSDPAHPAGTASLTMPGQAYGVSVAGNFAYVADGDKGMFAVDVSDPYRPLLASSFDTVGFSHEVVPVDGRLYVADGMGGLLILEKGAASGVSGGQAMGEDPGTAPSPITRDYSLHPPAASTAASPIAAVAQRSHAGRTKLTSNCVVSSAADSGAGTLRSCIDNATSGTTISFDTAVFPKSNPTTINLLSSLRGLDRGGVTIDASKAGVILDGRAIGPSSLPGLIYLQSEGNTVRGLQIFHYPHAGIEIAGSNNTVDSNVLSSNGECGLVIHGSSRGASNNTIIGNLIGTDAGGTRALGNTQKGIFVVGGASNNQIGGFGPGEGNIVSGSSGAGIVLQGSTTNGNAILGNYVGTDVTGTVALANAASGISIEVGAFNNLVQGNLLSGNGGSGVSIGDWGGFYNVVIGNRIGTDLTGTKAIPNGTGIFVGFMGGSFNRIGGLRTEDRNIIIGGRQGIAVMGPAAVGNVVLGNFIGVDITGRRALGNQGIAVQLFTDSRSIIGGATANEANVISTRGAPAFNISVDYNFIGGNYVGTDVSGQIAVGNNQNGAYVTGTHNVFQGNVIAHATESAIVAPSGTYTTIRRNSIHSNGRKGIVVGNVISAPVITRIDTTAVSGTACAGCEVEIFSDPEDEGRVFEGSVVADASGSFTLPLQRVLIGPNVTATATDPQGNTSEFSPPQAAPPPPPRRRAVRP